MLKVRNPSTEGTFKRQIVQKGGAHSASATMKILHTSWYRYENNSNLKEHARLVGAIQMIVVIKLQIMLFTDDVFGAPALEIRDCIMIEG